MTICQVAQPSQPLDKHARKIQNTLASYPAGSTVLAVMRDNSTRLGKLGAFSASSFELVLPTGDAQSLSYADVQRVQRADRDTRTVVVFRHRPGVLTSVIVAAAVVGLIILAAVELRKS